jgi:hypothetical protein
MHEMPESRCDFILQDADGESLMRRDCPEIRPGKAESEMLKVEIGTLQVEMPEMAESRCDFDLQDTVGELVMSHDCPEMGGKAEG